MTAAAGIRVTEVTVERFVAKIDQSNVSYIAKGRTWKYVLPEKLR